MKESVFGEKETENLNAEYQKNRLPNQNSLSRRFLFLVLEE